MSHDIDSWILFCQMQLAAENKAISKETQCECRKFLKKNSSLKA